MKTVGKFCHRNTVVIYYDENGENIQIPFRKFLVWFANGDMANANGNPALYQSIGRIVIATQYVFIYPSTTSLQQNWTLYCHNPQIAYYEM